MLVEWACHNALQAEVRPEPGSHLRIDMVSHTIAKHVEGNRDLTLSDLARMVPEMRVVSNDGRTAELQSSAHDAAIRLNCSGKKNGGQSLHTKDRVPRVLWSSPVPREKPRGAAIIHHRTLEAGSLTPTPRAHT